jgi:hypothetical protein
MGWNTSVLLAEGLTFADMTRVIPDIFLLTKRTLGWEDASSSTLDRDLALGEVPGWGVLWTPNIRVTLFPEVLEAASSKGRALTLVLSSVVNIYGFCLYTGGQERRRLLRDNRHQIVEDEGEPVPEEAQLSGADDEDTIWQLGQLLSGIPLNGFDTWADVRFTVATLGL